MSYMGDFSLVMKQFIKLPEGIEFYEIDEQIVFPMRIVDAPSTDSIIYLIKKGDPLTGKGFYKYGILLSELIKPYTDLLIQNIENAKAKEFNPDGGDMGLEG